MKRLNILVIIPAVLAALFCLPHVARAQKDFIRIPGKSQSGTITVMTKTKVTIDRNGVEYEIPVNTIHSIQFDTEPSKVTRARIAAQAGRYKDAIEDFSSINLANDIDRAIIKQDIAYYLAFCAAKQAISGSGDKKAAHDQLLAFLSGEKTKENFHYYQAAEVIGDLAVSRGKFEDAANYYKVIGGAPWNDYKLKAAILEAGALVASKKFPAALAKYEMVLSAQANTPLILQQKQYAKVGKAVCLSDTNPQQGIQLIQGVIDSSDPKTEKVLFAKAYNALGACHLKMNEPKEALEDYLHTHLLYYMDAQAHAEALYHLQTLWETVNKSDRAAQARNLLRTRYPGSAWNK